MRGTVVVLALVALMAAGANAVTFTGTATGNWVNVVSNDSSDIYGVTNGDAGGVAAFSWGLAGTYQGQPSTPSIFTFDGVGSDGLPGWSAASEAPFSIGAFEYYNGSSFFATGVNGVSLQVALSILTPLSNSQNYVFDFALTNTPNNTGDPVLDGDIVTSSNAFTPVTFSFSGIDYTLELLGFSSDGGTTIRTDFSSPESAWAYADVYARITSDIPPPSTPEPASMALLGLGIGGMIVRRLRGKA